MIIHFIPYSTDKNLGKAYNDCMSLLPNGASACFTDGDVMFLVPDWGHIIEEYSNLYPDAVLTCRTNRIHKLSKQLDGEMDEVCDIRENIKKAYERRHLRTVTEIKEGEGMSGLLMVVPKSVWEEVRFVERGLLGVDSQFRIDLHKAGKKILIMDGLFVFHQYRIMYGATNKDHLK